MTDVEIKAIVRYRDGFRCAECGLTQAEHLAATGRQLEVHRVVPNSDYSFDPGVCVTLCTRCHAAKPRSSFGIARARIQAKTGKFLMTAFLSAQHFAALEGFIGTHELRASRSSVLRAALAIYLEGKGFWPPKGGA